MKPNLNCRALAAALALLAATGGAPALGAGSVLPHIAFGEGKRADARAGVAAAAIGEVLDAPTLLDSADVRAFVSEGFAEFSAIAPEASLRERAMSERHSFETTGAQFDRARTLGAYGDFVKALIEALPPAGRRAFLAGDLAQSIAYNARVLRETAADGYRATLGGIADGDAGAPGLGDIRAQLQRLDAEDWLDSARLATRAVAAIVGSSETVPFPSAPRIWTILVRSRAPAGRAAAHVALDVVWFDGQHQTFAAFPDGDDFSKNADRLTCVRNREPSIGTIHATPLALPPERGYDALATSFAASCDAFNAKPPPYVVADAGDDRFVAAVLTAAGLDPKRAMGVAAK